VIDWLSAPVMTSRRWGGSGTACSLQWCSQYLDQLSHSCVATDHPRSRL